MPIAEQVFADFSGGLNMSADLSKIPDRECILADNCDFSELGNVQATGGTTKQNSVAYGGGANIHSLWINPTVRHLAGVGSDIFTGTALGSLANTNDDAWTSGKMSFADWLDKVFYETTSTPRWVDVDNISNTVDWPPPTGTTSDVGPNTAGSGANIAGPNTNWTNPNDVISSNDVYATAALTGGFGPAFSDPLRTAGFGYAIGGTDTVFGIKVEIEVKSSAVDVASFTQIQLCKAGTPVGSSKTSDPISTTESYITFGSSSDLWGTTWTPAEVNDANFGVQFVGMVDAGTSATISVDHVRITVTRYAASVSVATGAAGIPNGTYTYKVTFVDTDGNESEASAASASVAPASQIVNVTSIGLGDTRTRKRYVYRKGGLLTFYYFVGEISDNTTTSFADNLSDATVLTTGLILAGDIEGDRPNTRMGAATRAKYPALHYARLFWVDQASGRQNRLFWSKISHPWAYPAALFFDVGDEKPITRLVPFLDDLIIFKTDSIWRLSGNTESSFQLTRTPASVGCDMPFTVVKLQDRIMFCNSQGIYFFDGVTARPSTNRLDKFFDGQTVNGIAPIVVNSTTDDLAEACVGNGNKYYLAYSTNGTTNGRILVLDLDGGTVSMRTNAALSLASDPVTGEVYYGDSAGFIKKLDDLTATNDATASVSWAFQTKFFDQKRGDNKSYVGLELEIDTSSQSITPTVYFDNNTTSGTALTAVSTTARDVVYVPILASAARKARNISVKLTGTLATVNESNSPAVTLYGGKLYLDVLKQRSRTSVG